MYGAIIEDKKKNLQGAAEPIITEHTSHTVAHTYTQPTFFMYRYHHHQNTS